MQPKVTAGQNTLPIHATTFRPRTSRNINRLSMIWRFNDFILDVAGAKCKSKLYLKIIDLDGL